MTVATLYQPRPTGLQTLNPVTNLTLAVCLLVAAAALPNLPLVLAVYLLIMVPLAMCSQVAIGFLRTSARLIWPFALSLFLIQGFFTPGRTILLALGPFTYKAEGAAVAGLYTARLLVGLGTATLLMMTTRLDWLMLALVQRGLPSQAAYIVVTALQIIPNFQAKASAIIDAQRSRGLETEGPLKQRVRALIPLIGPLVLGSLMDLEERAIALEARGFSRRGEKTSLTTIPDSPIQRVLRWVLVVLTAGLVILRIVHGP